MAKRGRDTILMVNVGTAGAPNFQKCAAKQNDLQWSWSRGSTSISHKDSEQADAIAGPLEVSIRCSGLQVAGNLGLDKILSAMQLSSELELRQLESGVEKRRVACIVTSFNESAPADGPVTYDATFQPVSAIVIF